MVEKPSLEDSVERLLHGERIEDLARGDREREEEMRALQQAAQALRRAAAPEPGGAAERMALSRTLGELEAEAARPRGLRMFEWFSGVPARRLASPALVVLGAVLLFAGAGISAAAARGSTPAPVRAFMRMFDSAGATVTATPEVAPTGAAATTAIAGPGSAITGGARDSAPAAGSAATNVAGAPTPTPEHRRSAGAGHATETSVPAAVAPVPDGTPGNRGPAFEPATPFETPTPIDTPEHVDTPLLTDTPLPTDTPAPTDTRAPTDTPTPTEAPTDTPAAAESPSPGG